MKSDGGFEISDEAKEKKFFRVLFCTASFQETIFSHFCQKFALLHSENEKRGLRTAGQSYYTPVVMGFITKPPYK